MMDRIRAWLRALWYRYDEGAEPHYAQDLFAEWDAARRTRQLEAFVVARADLYAHGISDVN